MFNFSLDKINNLIKLDFQYIVLISFVLYTLFYYCSANLNIEKPDIKTIIFLLGFHVAHMFIVKKFYLQKDTAIAILILICPIIIYKLYAMYQRKQEMDYNMKMRFMMAQIQAMQQAQQQAQRQYVSPPVQQAQQNTNSQQLQYNELNRSLQGGNNGQHQAPPMVHPPRPEQKQGGIIKNIQPHSIQTVNVNGQRQEQFLEDTIRIDDFSPNYNSIQSGALIEAMQSGGVGIGAFDGNNYLNPSNESLSF